MRRQDRFKHSPNSVLRCPVIFDTSIAAVYVLPKGVLTVARLCRGIGGLIVLIHTLESGANEFGSEAFGRIQIELNKNIAWCCVVSLAWLLIEKLGVKIRRSIRQKWETLINIGLVMAVGDCPLTGYSSTNLPFAPPVWRACNTCKIA